MPYWAFLWLLPLGAVAFVPFPSLGFTLPKLAVFSVAALFCFLGFSWRRAASILPLLGRTWTGSFLLLYGCVLALSLAWSVAPIVSIVGAPPRFLGLLTQGMFLALGLMAFLSSLEEKGRSMLLRTILMSSALVTLYGFLQLLGLDPLSPVWNEEFFLQRIFSTIGQPNALGSFLLLVLPFGVLALGRARGTTGIFSLLLVLLNLIALLGTASRATLLGLAVIACIALFALRDQIGAFLRRQNTLIRSCMTLIFIAFLAFALWSFSARFEHAMERGRSMSARTIILSEAFAMLRERPQGYGLETIGIASSQFHDPKLYKVEGLDMQVDRVHNLPLDLLLTAGPLGLVAFSLFAFFLLRALWFWKEDGTALAGFCAITGYLVSLLFHFETVATGAFFWVICGWMLGIVLRGDAHRTSALTMHISSAVLAILFFTTVASVITSATWLRARYLLMLGERAFAQDDLGLSLQHLQAAQSAFRFDRDILVSGIEAGLTTLSRLGNSEDRAHVESFVDHSLERLSVLTGGGDGVIPLFSAWHAAVQSDANRAREELTRAASLQPNVILTYRIAAKVHVLLGDSAAEREAYRKLALLLPASWRDRSSARGRILWKENPWLREVEAAEKADRF